MHSLFKVHEMNVTWVGHVYRRFISKATQQISKKFDNGCPTKSNSF